ncbi:hypothetical protein BY996DRAFT_6432614 [Phakopsora pachyrhizi]|uniref:E3 ubiquitin-protein ligase n=1 Tax=Phakopsora pachyrhizi TaxID=170000 RepID=A0AAV0BSF6_PHAPC|nr:hypothetical protein BY996DRAFT_6432614 [Phakopsora pachyrhizi]CAH7689176.1 hypothetical protein PPACK8108_LOCUS24239 [Phakopsora pachyrhizi]
MDQRTRLQDTPIVLDGKSSLLRHQALNPIRHSISLHTFLSRIDYLVASNESLAFLPTRQNVSFCPETATQMLKILYSFAFEPLWAPYFFPSSSFTQLVELIDGTGNRIPVVSQPKVTPDFTLASFQDDEGIEYGPNRKGKPCGHVFQKGEGVYHCSDCGIDATCALCAKCFLASDHEGHDIKYSIHSTGCGCCDCGDEEAWETDIKCKYHSSSTEPSKSSFESVGATQESRSLHSDLGTSPLPEECKKIIEQIVTIALDFLLITLDRSSEDMGPPTDAEAIYNDLSRLEENTYLEMSRRPMHSVSDDSMDVDTQYSQHQNPYNSSGENSKSSTSSGLFSALWGSRAHDKGKGKITESSSNTPTHSQSTSSTSQFDLNSEISQYNPISHQYLTKNRTSQILSGSEFREKWANQHSGGTKPSDIRPKGLGPWGVVLWNDEKHSYAQVIDQVSKATGCSRAEALRIANAVDTKGRDVIQVSNDPHVLLHTSKMISRIDLTVTVRTVHDLFCEKVADLVIRFLVDLASCRLYNCSPEDENWIKSLITQKLCERPEIGYEGGDRTRFERLLLNDVKLWKEARDRLKVLYISLLSLGQHIKLKLGTLFASVFPQLIEYNLLIDREPEHNILLFSLQIVTVPSVVVVLVTEHNFLDMIIDLLYSFFTHQFLPAGVPDSQVKHIIYPPDYNKKKIDPEGLSFRHKRYYHLFNELNLVLSSPGVQAAICEDVSHLKKLISFLDLFTNMNPNKRAVHVHVEFESDAWVTAFNVTIQLAKLCKFFGECYARASNKQLVIAIQAVVQLLGEKEYEYHELQFGSAEALDTNSNVIGPLYKCISFRPDKELVSFHHPLNWLLAELMRGVHHVNFDEVNDIGVYGINDLLTPSNLDPEKTKIGPLIISEDVIRVASLLAQVRAGLWVRNGFGVRAQQLHYREYSLRETTFDQDIFHLQVLLASKDPSHVLVSIIDRFGLRQWCNGELLTDRVYEPSQMIAMLEELLHLIIILLSEPVGICNLSHEESLKREIIHVLCLSPMAYSDIAKRIPDRYMEEFDEVLKNLTNFKQPVGTSDVGIYSLKPKFLAEVDPYYCRYGRNQREEAENVLMEYLRVSTGESDPVMEPRSLNIKSGPFTCITQTYHSEVLLQMIFYSLARVNPTMKGYSEYLADQAIHLIMMGLTEEPEAFANMMLEKTLPLKGANPHTMSLAMMLEAVDAEPAMKGVKKKVNWCLDKIANIAGLQRQNGVSKDTISNAEKQAAQAIEQKKEAAKARQNAIMSQFAAAQQAFLMQNEFEDEFEDEDGEGEVDDPIAANKVLDPVVEKVYGNCIVCQEDLTLSRCFGALGLVQCSRMVRTLPLDDVGPEEADKWFEEALYAPESLDFEGRKDGPTGLASRQPVNFYDTRLGPSNSLEPVRWVPQGYPTQNNTRSGLFASACGHLMHLSCFQTYYKSIEQRHSTQVTRNHPESIERFEYLCPLCKSIGNVFLPSSDISTAVIREENGSQADLPRWLSSVEVIENQMKAEIGAVDYRSILPLTDHLEIKSWSFHDKVGKHPAANLLRSKPVVREEERAMMQRFLMVTDALRRELGEPKDIFGQLTLTQDLVGYTISCIEISQRGVAQANRGGVYSALTDNQRHMIISLLSVLGRLIEIESGTLSAKRYATGLLIRLLAPQTTLFSSNASNNASTPIVFTDPLSILIRCAAICPDAYSLLVPLCYYIEVVRVLLALCYYSSKHSHNWWQGIEDYRKTDQARLKEGSAMRQLVMKLFEICRIKTSNVILIDDLKLERLVRLFTLPFLRRAMILKSAIGEKNELELEEENWRRMAEAGKDNNEYGRLKKKLEIPSLTNLLQDETRLDQAFENSLPGTIGNLLCSWLKQLHMFSFKTGVRNVSSSSSGMGGISNDLFNSKNEETFFLCSRNFKLEHPTIYELLGLPKKFDKILGEAATRKCKNCNLVPNDPGICLFCGATVCVQAFCCTNRNLAEEPEHGECNVHMWNCGGSVAIYLLIKKCSILYLATENGTFSVAPYLDEHGEHDTGMKRGRPQYLHLTRWDEIRKNWLNHLIPTLVARRQENTTDVGGWPTF